MLSGPSLLFMTIDCHSRTAKAWHAASPFLLPAPRPMRALKTQISHALPPVMFIRPRFPTGRADRVQHLKFFRLGEFLQPRARPVGEAKVERLQVLEARQFLEPCVRYLGEA